MAKKFRNLNLKLTTSSLAIGIWLFLALNPVSSDLNWVDINAYKNGKLITPDLIKKYGYPAETHKVVTKDGFVLKVHRIPKPGRQPVLMCHGLFGSSAAYVILGPDRSLGFMLSDLGYDIWLLNTRGNRYSRKHKRYHRHKPQFWDFSFHELGMYDIPAAIDYILARSRGFRQLHYVGHSQGTTSFFVMGSERTAYMRKIKSMHALAPVAYGDHVESPYLLKLVKYMRPLSILFKTLGIYEAPPKSDAQRKVFHRLCSFIFQNTCTFVLMEIMGVDYQQFNTSLVPLFSGHTQAGSSIKSMEHYGQQIHSGGFFKFDYYNKLENLRRHGAVKPPQYNVSRVNCKVALYYAKNDRLTSDIDVVRLRNQLPNVILDFLIPDERFNHINFVWGNNMKTVINDRVVDIISKVERGEL